MNGFDTIMGQMTTEGNFRGEPMIRIDVTENVRAGSKSYNFSSASGKIEKGDSGSKSSGNYGKHLENMSLSALNNILSTYKKEVSSGIPDEQRSSLQSRIGMIEKEISSRGRSSNFSGTGIAQDVTSVNAQEKKYNIGATVGTSSLIFGVLGFMGSAFMGSKHPFLWGFLGAAAGGVTAFFISQDKDLKPISVTNK